MANVIQTQIRNRVRAARRTDRRGIAIIELAIVLLLLILLTFGILEYGWMFTKQGYVTNAARQGARVAVRPNGTVAMAQAAAQSALTQGNIPAGAATITVSPNPIPVDLASGSEVIVTVEVEYGAGDDAIGLGLPLLPKPSVLRARTVMAREGP